MTGALAQLALDDFLKVGKADGAFDQFAIDDKAGSALDAKESSRFHVFDYTRARLLGAQARLKLR